MSEWGQTKKQMILSHVGDDDDDDDDGGGNVDDVENEVVAGDCCKGGEMAELCVCGYG